LVDVVREAALSKPFLGLCLGPQALLEFSEENGGVECLKVLPGRVVWFGELRDPARRRAAQGAAHGLESGPSTARSPALAGDFPRQPLLFRP
jgi:anthranilate/para-aminobenzoate synthase component II